MRSDEISALDWDIPVEAGIQDCFPCFAKDEIISVDFFGEL